MPKLQPSKTPNKRQKKKQDLDLSAEDIELPVDPVESPAILDGAKDIVESFKEMSEEEMAEHLKLCMKMSAENKINIKNAFGLHLIGILQKMVNKKEKADIQQASLSLQASSKIYAGRVEALYQDTMKFHSHLQSIVSGGKKDKKKNADEEGGDDEEEDSDKGKTKSHKSKCKSFLKAEETLSIEQNISSSSTKQPHGNFVTINSAFSTSRLAPKLLSSLLLSDDSCKVRCAVPELCFKPLKPLTNEVFQIPPKLEGILEKIKNFNVDQLNIESLSDSTKDRALPSMSTPKPIPLSPNFDDESVFAPPDPVSSVDGFSDDGNLEEAGIDKFDVLNITVDAFVNDISAAVTNRGVVDHRLLPPNSVLKKMLDQSRRASVRRTIGKSTKKKLKEPFFATRSADEMKHLFGRGRATSMSQKVLSEWSVENTTDIDLGYEFIELLEGKKEPEYTATLDQVLDVVKQKDTQHHLKYYFNKMSQVWKFSRRKLCIEDSFADVHYGDQTEKRVGSIAPSDPEGLAISFQHLSLNDSNHETTDSGGHISFNEIPDTAIDDGVSHDIDDNDSPCIIDTEEQQYVPPLEPFETDIEDLMVKPPELVRPASMKFDKRPLNLNTEKIKDLMQLVIFKQLASKRNTEDGVPSVLFSEVYEELKSKLEREISEFISMQFAFVVLLILANQKTLLIENVNTDLSIKQDICETEASNDILN